MCGGSPAARRAQSPKPNDGLVEKIACAAIGGGTLLFCVAGKPRFHPLMRRANKTGAIPEEFDFRLLVGRGVFSGFCALIVFCGAAGRKSDYKEKGGFESTAFRSAESRVAKIDRAAALFVYNFRLAMGTKPPKPSPRARPKAAAQSPRPPRAKARRQSPAQNPAPKTRRRQSRRQSRIRQKIRRPQNAGRASLGFQILSPARSRVLYVRPPDRAFPRSVRGHPPRD